MGFKKWVSFVLAGCLLTSTCAFAAPGGQDSSYAYSWVANDGSGFEDGQGIGTQMPHEIASIFVTPDGTVYTNCDWEEDGHNFAEIKDGKITNIGLGTHGWGYEGGLAVTANDKYVYYAQLVVRDGLEYPQQPESGLEWQGVQRRYRSDIQTGAYFDGGTGRDGDNGQQIRYSFLPVIEAASKTYQYITGMAASNERLFVSSLQQNKIWVYNAETMAKISEWDVDSPNTIVLDKNGVLWVNQKSTNKIIAYDEDGNLLGREISFGADVVPQAMCVDNQNRLLISDIGAKEWIMVYGNLDTTPTFSHNIGAEGGVYSGVPGKMGDMKFYHITGLGVDAKDNLYVASGSTYYQYKGTPESSKQNAFVETGGSYIECYDKNDQKLWDLSGLNFVDTIAMDPTDETAIYTDVNKLKMDYTKSPGEEWSYEAFTINPHKYPDDMRIQYYGPISFTVATQMVTVRDHKYFLVSNMPAAALAVYRFNEETDGEVAIPCAVINGPSSTNPWPPNRPESGSYIWVDTDADGQMDAGEYKSLEGYNPEGRNWFMDTDGNLYLANNQDKSVLTLPFKSIDQNGVIDWDETSVERHFTTGLYADGELRRVHYEEETDRMYVMIQTPEWMVDEEGNYVLDENGNKISRLGWLEAGQHLVVYDNWSDKSSRTVRYKVTMPLMDRKINDWDTALWAPMGMSVAGDYIFVGYGARTLTYVLNKETGAHYDTIIPPQEQGSSWAIVDTAYSFHSLKLSNGEYVIFVEDDLKSKNFMIRWTPEGGVKNYNANKEWGVYVDGRQILCDKYQPYMASGTLVAPYSVLRAMGATVDWREGNTELTITAANGTVIKLRAESPIAEVNGVNQVMDANARVRRGMFYVPVANVALWMGAGFERDNTERIFNFDMDGALLANFGTPTFEN